MRLPASMRTRRHGLLVTGVAGMGLLGASFTAKPGSRTFYGLTFALAGTWFAGARATWLPGAQRRVPGSVPVVVPAALGVGAFAAFYGAALIARQIPVLGNAITSVLSYDYYGSSGLVLLTAVVNGAAEELFFRGAVYDALASGAPVLASTAAYATVTAATRNPALVLASAVMGTLFALERRLIGGVHAPVITHLVWSALMLRHMPSLFTSATSRLDPPTSKLVTDPPVPPPTRK